MSISGNTTPKSESFEGFEMQEAIATSRLTPTPIKRFKSCLNKISERNFPKISDEMLTIHLLEEPENLEENSSDKESMLPVVETFMANVCVFERNIEAINVYTKTFCKLKDNWKGRQGKVLMETMLSELSKFFPEYNKLIESSEFESDSEAWIKKRNQCLKLCQFTSGLYNEGGVSIKLILVILTLFMKPKKECIEVFCKLFSGSQEKLMKDELFNSKILPKFKGFLEEHHKSKTLEPMYRFMCLEILDKC